MVVETIIGLIIEHAGMHIIGETARKETVQRILRKAKLSPDNPPSDFESLYTYTLIEYGVGKPREVLDLFRSGLVREAYQRAFEQRDPGIFEHEVSAYLESEEGQELYGIDYNPLSEFSEFADTFIQLANRTRTVSEIRRDQKLEDIHDTTKQLLTHASQAERTPAATSDHAYIAPRPVNSEMLTAAQAQQAAIPLDHVPNVAPLPYASIMPLRSNPHFVGRGDILNRLAHHLRDENTKVPTVVITGIGGIGKTQLASEIAHRYGQYFAGGVFWLSCVEPDTLLNAIAACGRQGLVDWRPGYDSLSPQEQAQLVLSAWQSPMPRLLIFDNCEDPKLLARWRPTTGGCVILVTSRRASWEPTTGIIVYPLEILQREESTTLLRQFRPDLATEETDLDALANELGDLPLALHLAGSYLRTMKHGMTTAEYLLHLETLNLLDHPSLQGWRLTEYDSPTEHEQHVAKTFALSYEQLTTTEATDKLARDTLECAAVYAPGEVIPRNVLHAALDEELTIHDKEAVLIRLTDLGLLDQEADGGMRLHRLLGRFIQTQDEDINTIDWSIEALIKVADEYKDQGYNVKIVALHSHLWHIGNALLNADRMDELTAYYCHQIAYYCTMIGDYSMAQSLYEHALAIREKTLGPNHPTTALTLDNLASVLQDQGNYDAALSLCEHALAIREKTLDPNHPHTADSINNRALLLQHRGNYNDAKALLKSALAIYEQSFGPHHPNTVNSLNNLAALLHRQGEYTAAHSLYERALHIHEQVLGPSHPTTATSLNNLALLLRHQGHYDAAYPLYQRALAIREKTLGPNHPETAISLGNLASLLQDQGEYTAAHSLYECALHIHEQALGPSHPTTATSVNNLASLLQDQGHYDAAYPLYQRALVITEQTLGPHHPNTAISLSNLANLLYLQCDYDAARPLFERALTIREQVLGPDHPDTASSLSHLAGLFYDQGNYDAATRTLFERALAIREQALGPHHPDTASSLNNLAGLFYDQGNYDAARPLFERALAIREKTLGPNHPDTASSLNNLAGLFYDQGHYDAARPLFERALTIREQVLGPHHYTTITSLNNLANLLYLQRDYDTAYPLYKRALTICEQTLGPNHTDTVTIRKNLEAYTQSDES